jgi:hypothetical protein
LIIGPAGLFRFRRHPRHSTWGLRRRFWGGRLFLQLSKEVVEGFQRAAGQVRFCGRGGQWRRGGTVLCWRWQHAVPLKLLQEFSQLLLSLGRLSGFLDLLRCELIQTGRQHVFRQAIFPLVDEVSELPEPGRGG